VQTKSANARGTTGAEQWRKSGITATSMANTVAAQNQQRKVSTAETTHQAWYHWLLP